MRKISTEDMVRAIPGNEDEVVCEEGFVRYVEGHQNGDMALVAHGTPRRDEWFHIGNLELVS